MPGRSNPNWDWLAFFACFLAVGIPYWLIPYSKVNLPDALIAPGLLIVGLSALLLRWRRNAPFWRVVRIVGATVPSAVLARVLVEGVMDPTSHNLWPLEVLIALMLGLAVAAAGAVLGSVLAKVSGS